VLDDLVGCARAQNPGLKKYELLRNQGEYVKAEKMHHETLELSKEVLSGRRSAPTTPCSQKGTYNQ
jgi:hypothetical protein